MLIEVYGIGRWTVEMFAIFSLRRPNILPVGDLGVQRGVCRWFLSLYAPEIQAVVSPKKKALAAPVSKKKNKGMIPDVGSASEMQVPRTPKRGSPSGQQNEPGSLTPLAMSSGAVEIPPAFTPSIAKTLNREASQPLPLLPDGLTATILKSRLAGKKVKGAFLTPKEMEELTECWAPYRSLGVYYMWSIAGGEE